MLLGSLLVEVNNRPQIHDSPIDLVVRGGAGYSFRGNQYGLGVDNTLAYNVVLPDGTPVTATKDEYDDLFWALKVSSTTRSSKPNHYLTIIGKIGWRQQLRTSLILPGLCK